MSAKGSRLNGVGWALKGVLEMSRWFQEGLRMVWQDEVDSADRAPRILRPMVSTGPGSF